MSKIDQMLFSAHEQALDKELEACPLCGGKLGIKNSKKGRFIGCHQYPACDYTRPLSSRQSDIEKVLTGSECPECGHELALKKGRYGLFIGCTHFPDCQHIEHIDEPGHTGVTCPFCLKGQLIERKSRYGKLFYACDHYPKCRYVVNHKPVNEPCPECGWGLLMEKKTQNGKRLCCPQKKCGYKGPEF